MEVVIGLIVILLAWSYLKARFRIYHSNKIRAKRTLAAIPAYR